MADARRRPRNGSTHGGHILRPVGHVVDLDLLAQRAGQNLVGLDQVVRQIVAPREASHARPHVDDRQLHTARVRHHDRVVVVPQRIMGPERDAPRCRPCGRNAGRHE